MESAPHLISLLRAHGYKPMVNGMQWNSPRNSQVMSQQAALDELERLLEPDIEETNDEAG